MLLHHGGHAQPSCYYPDPSFLSQHATPPPPHFDLDAFLSHPAAYQSHGGPAAAPCPPAHQQPPQSFYSHAAASGGFPQLSQHHLHGQQASQHSHSQHGPHSPYYGPCPCGCLWKPVQETFLHKILTGKGYKNDAMCVGRQRGQQSSARAAESAHYSHAAGQGAGMGADFAIAASCCYTGLSAMSVSAAAFPPSIAGL